MYIRYEARIDCVRRGGDLALISSEGDRLAYGGYVIALEVLTGTMRNYWVGLAQRLWTASDGNATLY